MTDTAEIAVIGAGVIGLTIALRLAAEGRGVLVIDPAEPGSGASYGNAGTIAGPGRPFDVESESRVVQCLLHRAPCARVTSRPASHRIGDDEPWVG